MSVGGPPSVPAANPYAAPTTSINGGVVAVGAGYKSATPLAKAIVVLLGLDVVLVILGDLNSYLTIGVMQRVAAGDAVPRAELTALAVRSGAIAVPGGAVLLAVAILFCLFMARANRNARWFRAPLQNSPGWAAGWFFVPIAGLWMPYQAMKEIWEGSDPDPTVAAVERPGPALLKWWWGIYLAHNFAGVGIAFSRDLTKGVQTSSPFVIANSVLSIAAAVVAAAVVRAVARRQDERQRRELASARPAATAGAAP